MLGFGPLASFALADDSPRISVALTGVSATSAVGSVTLVTDHNISVSGVSSTAAVGAVAASGAAVVSISTGLEATSAVGSVLVSTSANLSVAGIAGTASVGVVTQRTTAVIPVVFTQNATGVVGALAEVRGSAIVYPTGVASSGRVGTVLVWGRIVPDENTVWTEIVAA
jgi:hypothetical protein